jgi:ubiquinone/menaquinone biosynthesis C-methylase UbiE
VPESEVGLLPAELAHNSEAQLASAREFQREFGIEFPLLHGNAEEFPFPGASFDLAISEYGARRPLG